MKIAVDFLYKNRKKRISSIYKIDYLNYIKYGLFLVILTIGVTAIGVICLKSDTINSNILYMASNIRQAESKEVDKAEVMLAMNNMASPFVITGDKARVIEEEEAPKEDKEEKKNEGFDVSLVDATEVIAKIESDNLSIKDTESVQKINVYGMTISNYSSKRNIDFLALFKKNITLTKKSDPILIYSTHTSESYTNSDRYKFEYSSTYRTRDAKYNMLSVGNILVQALEERNMQVIFDTTPHDYGSYEIAYTNSRKTIQNQLSKNERIGLAIDVHRDALGDLTNGPTVEINGQKVAKLMFVMGVGTDSYANQYWEDNLALALQLQKLGEEMYPGLFRGMIVRNSKYNQDLIKHSLLIEVGTTGNTLEEAYFGVRCLANILNKFYNN